MNEELPISAKIAFALGARNWPHLRQIALSIATKQIFELHKYGRFPAGMQLLDKILLIGMAREGALMPLFAAGKR